MIAWMLMACVSSEQILEAHDRMGQDAADAWGATLVVAEWTRHTSPQGDARHENTCGCPCSEAIGTDTSFVNELDYAAPSCIPWSGVLPATTTGHVWLDMQDDQLHVDRVQASVGGDPASASIDGRVLSANGSVSLVGTVDVGDIAVQLDIDLRVDGSDFVIDGTYAMSEVFTVSDLRLRRDQTEADDGCPFPSAGEFRGDEGGLTFGDGIEATWRKHTETYEACRWKASFLDL